MANRNRPDLKHPGMGRTAVLVGLLSFFSPSLWGQDSLRFPVDQSAASQANSAASQDVRDETDTGRWSLESCIRYAEENNIDLRQSSINERLAALQLKQSRLDQLPNVSFSLDYGRSFGRSIDPTTNQFINGNYDFAGVSGNASFLLFGWFQKRHTINRNKLSLEAARADYSQLEDDIALNIATVYLKILLAKAQISIAEHQLHFTEKQKSQTQSFVEAGRLPALELAQMEAQLATDSAAYFTATAEHQNALLEMKAIMNLDIAAPFELALPATGAISYTEVMAHSPAEIFEIARATFSSIESQELKIAAARKGVQARRAALWPQLGMGAQLGSNYASSLKEITDLRIVGASPTGDFVQVNGQPIPVMQPDVDFSSATTPLFTQLNNNFRQTLAISLTIPILNGWTARTAVDQAKADLAGQRLEAERLLLQLKQDVYNAYYNAQVAIRKYSATAKAAEAAEKALDFAEKRYELGLMNGVELLTTQNTHFQAKTEEASARYDLIFKLKVIDYYLGKDLHL